MMQHSPTLRNANRSLMMQHLASLVLLRDQARALNVIHNDPKLKDSKPPFFDLAIWSIPVLEFMGDVVWQKFRIVQLECSRRHIMFQCSNSSLDLKESAELSNSGRART